MQSILGDLISALRQAGLPISSAETLDALKAAQLVGIDNAPMLKQALGMTLTKRLEHRLVFDQIFELFFSKHEQLKTSKEEAFESENSIAINKQPKDTKENVSNLALNVQSTLAQQLISNDVTGMQMMIASAGAGAGAGVQEMSFTTQVPMISYRIMQALDDSELQQELTELAKQEENSTLVQLVRQRRSRLQQQVRNYVEQQFLLFSSNEPQKLRESNIQKLSLTNIDQRNYKLMGELVRKAAKRLASMHSRRRRITKRGLLDVRRTIAANAAYDGFLFHTRWKSTRIDRPKVFVICDISGSVSKVARFLLLFLYSLQDVLPNVRSFVFSSDLHEVTKLFEQHEMDRALGEVIQRWGNKPTYYGKALSDFQQLALDDIDKRTTVIMLGDARNNHEEGNESVWEEVYRRSARVLWLNPEDETNWDSGDSIMRKYAPYCSIVETCNSLRSLNRILGSVLKQQT